jgi:hypothetical protein
MSSTQHSSLRRRVLLALPAAAVTAALLGTPAMAATPAPQPVSVSPAGSTTQGIIMRDGGVCDPIRHMGC